MILKALDVYYIVALSKRDLKPFLQIEKCPKLFFLVLQVVVFSKIAAGGYRKHEPYGFSKRMKNTQIEIEIVYTSEPKHVKIQEIIQNTSTHRKIK